MKWDTHRHRHTDTDTQTQTQTHRHTDTQPHVSELAFARVLTRLSMTSEYWGFFCSLSFCAMRRLTCCSTLDSSAMSSTRMRCRCGSRCIIHKVQSSLGLVMAWACLGEVGRQTGTNRQTYRRTDTDRQANAPPWQPQTELQRSGWLAAAAHAPVRPTCAAAPMEREPARRLLLQARAAPGHAAPRSLRPAAMTRWWSRRAHLRHSGEPAHAATTASGTAGVVVDVQCKCRWYAQPRGDCPTLFSASLSKGAL